MISVIGKAINTPFAPYKLLNSIAAGIITATYRITEIISYGIPLLSASSTPQ